jgi:FkbM family methyltransferase
MAAARVFIDVGGHLGETLEEVVKPAWRFDRIYVFEPASVCLPSIERFADARVEVVQAGWAAVDGSADLFGAGEIGASIHAGKPVTSAAVETIRLLDCAAWVDAHLDPTEEVWTKINCEGAECDVLDHLCETGSIARIDHLVVHFDVEKIPGMEHRAVATRSRLDSAGIEWIEAGDIMFGRSRALMTANWLNWTQASRVAKVRYRWLNRAIFRVRQIAYPLKQRLGR